MGLEKLGFRRDFKIHVRLSPHCYYLDPLVLEEKAHTLSPIFSTLITSLSRDWPLTSTFLCVNSPQVSQKRNKKVTSYLCHKHTGNRGRATTHLQVKLQTGPWTGMSAGNFSGEKKKKVLLSNSAEWNTPPTSSSSSVPSTTPLQRDALISICSKKRRASGRSRREHSVNSIINP